jgi:hypothetical protein
MRLAHCTNIFNSGNARKWKIRPIQNNLYDNLYVAEEKAKTMQQNFTTLIRITMCGTGTVFIP